MSKKKPVFSEKAIAARREVQRIQGAITRGLDTEHYVQTGEMRYCPALAGLKKKMKRMRRKL